MASASGCAADRTTCSRPSPPMPARRSHSVATAAGGRSMAFVRVGDDHEVVLGPVPLEEGDRRVLMPRSYGVGTDSAAGIAAAAPRPADRRVTPRQRSRATRQTASDDERGDDHATYEQRRPASPGGRRSRGPAGRARCSRRGGRPSCPSPRRSSRSAGPAWRRPRRRRRSSKASGKANIREPSAARRHDGRELPDPQPALRAQLDLDLGPADISSGSGPSAVTPSGVSSGPSGLSRSLVRVRASRTAVRASRAVAAVSRGPASIATRPPNSDSTWSIDAR